MELSQTFSMPANSETVRKHNQMATEVMAAFEADRPLRVPYICGEWVGQHGFYAQEVGLDYTQYYTDPDLMLKVQLETARRRRELPLHDNMQLCTVPEEDWCTGVDLWPVVAAGWLGCPVVYNKDFQVANHSLSLSTEECDALSMPDLEEGGLMQTLSRFYHHFETQYDGKLEFLGKPVRNIKNGVGSNGLFSLALDVRGADIMADMYEDPDFAHRFLQKLADWMEALGKHWDANFRFPVTDHGIDMLSPQLYEDFILPIVLEKRKEYSREPVIFHHCGRGQQLFPIIAQNFNLVTVHAVTWPFLDIEKIREVVGPDVYIVACIEESLVQNGSNDEIRYGVKTMLSPRAKGAGRFSIMSGDLVRGTDMDHLYTVYEAVQEYGTYS